MSSKMVNERFISCDQVDSANTKYRPAIRRSSEATLGEGAGEHATGLLDRAVGKMRAGRDRLEAAETEVKRERSESVAATAKRDQAAEVCRQKVLPLRNTVMGLFGETYARGIGFVGATPDQPVGVYRLCSELLVNVSKVAAPTATIGEVAVGPAALIQPLAGPTEALRLALKETTDEQRDSDMAQMEKNAAIAEYDRAFAIAANLMSTFLEIAGERDLARRVRPSNRRPGTTVEVAGGQTEVELPADAPVESGASTTSAVEVAG